MDIGDKLKLLRRLNNLTLKELSYKTSISVSFISDIENKRRNPSIENLRILSNALGVSTGELLDENSNSDLDKAILRIKIAINKMSKEDFKNMMKILEAAFPKYFNE